MIWVKRSPLWWLEWGSTCVLFAGVALTAWNVYPLNVWVSLIGNAGWLWVAIAWKKPSLITIQLVISALYLAGLVWN